LNFRSPSIFPTRSAKLAGLGFRNYPAYLASDCWRQRRAAYWAAHGRRCHYCRELAAHLHHRSYKHLGAEPDEDLEGLCAEHHREAHRYGSIQPATDRQRTILRENGYGESLVSRATYGFAFDLIGRIGRGEERTPHQRGM
jgi:hypothetical protein